MHSSRSSSSPIYAQPRQHHNQNHDRYYHHRRRSSESGQEVVNEYPNTASSFTYIPCAKYRPAAPEFRAPPPPPVANDFEQAELDFLAELDAQIAELQVLIKISKIIEKWNRKCLPFT